jgi:hypothetical protein
MLITVIAATLTVSQLIMCIVIRKLRKQVEAQRLYQDQSATLLASIAASNLMNAQTVSELSRRVAALMKMLGLADRDPGDGFLH